MVSSRTTLTLLVGLALFPASVAYANKATVTGKVKADGNWKPAVVYIEKLAGPSINLVERPKLTQKNTQFLPTVLVVLQGQTIDFPNEDKFYHNVFSASDGNEFDLGLYRGGVSKAMQMKAPGEVDIYCNIHPDMAAKVLVLQNELFTKVNDDGTYVLPNVPYGNYTLVAWTPHHTPEKKKIEVKADKPATADFALKARDEATSHLNKDGQPYGRYK
ncbi:MAG: hypothetical protein IT381_08925 [Deltaproteobacteria bacterium]|nr:hypothetical protein [Deltaproteobacteria bacterium]